MNNNNNNNSFKMYNDEESNKLKKYMTDTLTNINAQIKKFMQKYENNPKLQNEINLLMYQHPIYNTRKKFRQFVSKLDKSGEIIKDKLEDFKKETKMYQKRKDEIENIKNFVDVNYLKMLPDDKEKNKKNKKNEKKEEKKENKQQEKKENEFQSSNIIADFTIKDEKKENKKEEDDDIKIEDISETKNKYLNKKRSKQKNDDLKRKSVLFKSCYICRTNFTEDNIHQFYTNLCKKCGDYNYSFRTMKLDFTNRIAIVTGGRVKIGYYIATKLLSYGCKVLITSRFPKDTLLKYQANEDYNKWKNNLIIYPIDFRIFESTVKFVNFIKKNFPHIDILINNAAQTIRRTSAYYKYLLPNETKKFSKEDESKIIKNDYINLQKQLEGKIDDKNEHKLSEEDKNALISLSSNSEFKEILPLSVIASQIRIMEEKNQPNKTMIGSDGQTYDFSSGKNSWNLELDEVSFQEFTEVQIINTWTPFYLCGKLKSLFEKSPFPDRYIINVSSVEGIFNHYKRTSHPHTNMAKAALNMMTKTVGPYYKNFGIYMTSVDTGWVSPMNEMNSLLDKNKRESYEKEFCNIPLDELDGAMRVLHPIIEGIKNKNYLYGILLKDYVKSPW